MVLNINNISNNTDRQFKLMEEGKLNKHTVITYK